MKNLILFFAGFLLAAIALAAVPSAIGQDLQKTDPVEYRQRLMKLSNTELRNMVRVAFEQRDVDALTAGVESEVTSVYFADEYESCKDDDLKLLLALRMLRSETIFKPLPALAIVRSGESTKFFLMRMIVSQISERLGDVGPAEDLVADAKLRLRVAARLDASLKGLPLNIAEPRPSKEPVPADPSSPVGVPDSKTSTLLAPTGFSQVPVISAWPWVVGILTILLAGVLALKRRAS